MTPTKPPASDADAGPWAVRLPRGSTAAAAVRLLPGVVACDAADGLWLRGDRSSPSTDLALRMTPGAERFAVGDGGALTIPGRRVPVGTLPTGDWRPAAERFRPTLPRAALAGRLTGAVQLRLARSDRPRPANVLVLPLAAWAAWAVGAPQVRLRPLSFAGSADGRVVVRGSPLPPLPGTPYAERDGVAAPAGYEWAPAVDPATVRAVLGTAENDLALLTTDNTWERITADQFVAATRSAVRATAAAFA